MATLSELIDKLVGSGAAELNLDFDAITENYVNVNYKELDDFKNDPELKKSLLTYYRGEGRKMIDEGIRTIKSAFASVKESLKSLQQGAVQAPMLAQPSMIISGAATGVPNPAYTTAELMSTKKTMEGTLNGISNNLASLLTAADKINFDIPNSVTSMVNQVANVRSVISAIP